MENSQIIAWLLGLLLPIFTGVVLWKLRAQTEKNERFADAITRLESTAVSDKHVREIIREEMEQVNIVLPKLLESMHSLEKYISEERGYKAGQAAARSRAGDGKIYEG